MIKAESFIFECDDREERKDNQRDNFLYDFQMPKAERTSVAVKTYPVSRNLEEVFKQGDSPTDKNDNK